MHMTPLKWWSYGIALVGTVLSVTDVVVYLVHGIQVGAPIRNAVLAGTIISYCLSCVAYLRDTFETRIESLEFEVASYRKTCESPPARSSVD